MSFIRDRHIEQRRIVRASVGPIDAVVGACHVGGCIREWKNGGGAHAGATLDDDLVGGGVEEGAKGVGGDDVGWFLGGEAVDSFRGDGWRFAGEEVRVVWKGWWVFSGRTSW